VETAAVAVAAQVAAEIAVVQAAVETAAVAAAAPVEIVAQTLEVGANMKLNIYRREIIWILKIGRLAVTLQPFSAKKCGSIRITKH
jgi:hypothetical protein